MSKDLEHDELEVDRGMPLLPDSKRSHFMIAAGITTVLGVLAYISYSTFAQATDAVPDELQAQVASPYDREKIKAAPEYTVVYEPAPEPMLALPKPVHPVEAKPVDTGLSQEELRKRRRSPLVIYDVIQKKEGDVLTSRPEFDREALVDKLMAANSAEGIGNSNDMDDLDERLKSSETASVKASVLQDPDFLIAQGKTISAIIETAVSSDLPGKVRAVVNEVIYSENGVTPIITKGSRVIGEYRAGIVRGQGRLFVIWNRIITPEGVDIQIQSPGTDQLGRSGHDGWIDTHFTERFGASFLLSTIGAAASQSGDSAFEQQLGDNLNSSAEIALSQSIDIRPTLHKNQGEAIHIFVARDLNFRDAMMLVQR